MIDLGFDNKTVVVTGGAAHVGRGIVHEFARQQARIAVVDLDEDRAALTCQEALDRGAVECVVIGADLSTAQGCDAAIGGALAAFGGDGIDVLVNNFGWGEPGGLMDSSGDYWDRLWHMNLACTIACSQAALGDMKQRQRGSIVSIASAAAEGLAGPFAVYGALKAGVVTFTKSVAREFGRYDIRANVVAPGIVLPTEGAMGAESVWVRHTPLTERQIEAGFKGSALGRGSTAQDIAHAVLFLASDVTARQVTGQLLSVSGGAWLP